MAANYWTSSHHNRWNVDRNTVRQARFIDKQQVDGADFFDYCNIFFANAISKLGRKLKMRQRVIATAIIYFKRFYLKNNYSDTDPLFVAAACCYVAAKAEESPIHIKQVAHDAHAMFAREKFGGNPFPTETSKLAEMEFYLMDELECDLTIFHPYRTLMSLCRARSSKPWDGIENEVGELGIFSDEKGASLLRSQDERLVLEDAQLQRAWFIINDTYRSDIPLIHPPHLIAMTALFLALSQHFSSKAESNRNANSMDHDQPNQSGSTDVVGFLAGLNVSMTAVANVAQDIIALYTIWDKYRDADDAVPDTQSSTSSSLNMFSGSARGGFPINTQFTSRRGGASPLAGTPLSPTKKSTPGTPMSPPVAAPSKDNVMTQVHVAIILKEMRQFRFQSLFPPARHVGGPSTPQSSHSVSHNMQYGMSFSSGRWPAVAVNKQLERTQHMG